jgi:protein phosphatase
VRQTNVADLSQRIAVAVQSETGLKRQTNEDAYDYHIPTANSARGRFGALFVVADGVGSLGAGDEASKAAIATLLDTYYDPELDDDDPRERLIAAVQDANEAVRARSRSLEASNMGTTLAGAAMLPDGRTFIFHVGDSRVYRLRGQTLQQLTADHSAVDMASRRPRSKLTSYVGQPTPVTIGVSEQPLQMGDTLVICSDGLWGLVEEAEIAALVAGNSLEGGVQKLIERVYANGARDNVTVMLVQYRAAARSRRVYWLAAVLLVAALLIALVAGGGLAAAPPEVTATPAEATPLVEIVPDVTEDTAGHLTVRTPTPPPS